MSEQPAATPAAPVAPATPAPAPAPAKTEQTPAPGENDGKVTLSTDEYKNLQRDAARYRSRKTPSPEDKRNQRYNQPPPAGGESADEEVNKLHSTIKTYEQENLQLKLNNKVRDLLEADEYKALPETAKRILKKNPMSIVDPRAKTLDDALADIQDFMDDELSFIQPQKPGEKDQPPVNETPPVPGSVPTPPKTTPEESTEGKTGSARSTTILKNIFKQGPKPKS